MHLIHKSLRITAVAKAIYNYWLEQSGLLSRINPHVLSDRALTNMDKVYLKFFGGNQDNVWTMYALTGTNVSNTKNTSNKLLA